MEWLQTSIVVIILGLTCISADKKPEAEFCRLEEHHQNVMLNQCFESSMNVTEFQYDLQYKLYGYSGDDVVLLEFVQKYCPIGINVVNNCFTSVLNISEHCRNTSSYMGYLINSRVFGAIVPFLCDNDGEALLAMMKNKGFEYIVKSENTDSCFTQLISVPKIDEATNTYQISPKLCEAIGGVSDCYLTATEANDNKNLPRLMKIIFDKILKAFECHNIQNKLK